MSSALANLSVSVPFSSSNRALGSKGSSSRVQPFISFKTMGPRDYYSSSSKMSVRAVAAGGDGRRDSLDHLQKATKQPQSTQQQPQPKKRVVQVAQPIGLWDRFPSARTVQQMMDTMDRMMEDPLAYTNTWSSSPVPRGNGTTTGYRRGRTPWEIKEGEEDFKMRFDMPGMTKEDVKVWVEEKMLVVKAEKMVKNNEEQNEDAQAVWSAKSYGRYNSRIALPENIEFEKIKAEVKDGVLYITIPKASTSSKIWDVNVQ